MEKNWLIRTKSNHILGPISKEKLQELYRNGSVKSDDEICSGNGFWFFIRENDLVEKFLLGSDTQAFNPISEAKDVLNKPDVSEEHTQDHGNISDITLVGSIKIPNQQNAEESNSLSDEKDKEPDLPPPVEVSLDTLLKKNRKEKKPSLASTPIIKKTDSPNLKKQGFLKWLGIIGFIILFCLIYFRKRILRSLFEDEYALSRLSPISLSFAQDEIQKKKR